GARWWRSCGGKVGLNYFADRELGCRQPSRGAGVKPVTALTAEAASFSGCISPTRAQPGPGCNVPCAVAIGVHAAVHRTDNSVLLRARASAPALVAVDARVSRV